MNLSIEQQQTHIENKLVVVKGEGFRGEMEREVGVCRSKLGYMEG